jgi:hypothetical protein
VERAIRQEVARRLHELEATTPPAP